MTNKNKYKQAFSVLHASDDIDLEVLMMKKEKNKKGIIKKVGIAVAGFALLFVGSNGIAYAATGSTWVSKIINFTTANGSEVEIVQNENSTSFTVNRDEQESSGYVDVQNGRLYFVLGDIREDVTDKCSDTDYYQYEYTDNRNLRHVILVGGTAADAGWAELIFDENGTYIFNQMDVDATSDSVWLFEGMHAQGVPTGNPEYDLDVQNTEEWSD